MEHSYKVVITQGIKMELHFAPDWVQLIRSTAFGSGPARVIGSDNGTVLPHSSQHWREQPDQRYTQEECIRKVTEMS